MIKLLTIIAEVMQTLLGIVLTVWRELKKKDAEDAKERLSDDPIGELNRLFNSHESANSPRKTQD